MEELKSLGVATLIDDRGANPPIGTESRVGRCGGACVLRSRGVDRRGEEEMSNGDEMDRRNLARRENGGAVRPLDQRVPAGSMMICL